MRPYPAQSVAMPAATKPRMCSIKYCRNPRHQQRTICAKHVMQEWRRNNPVTEILNTIRGRARRKKIECTITLAEFKVFCAEHNYQPRMHHIDRIEAIEGYHIWNIQVLGGGENIAKGNRERHSERYQAWLATRKSAAAAEVVTEMECPY